MVPGEAVPGSSVPPILPIPEIQGLWMEADMCNCDVHSTVEAGLVGVPVRCYHYFVGTRAISGYIRLGEEKEKNRATAIAAQLCDMANYTLTQNAEAGLRRILNQFRTGSFVAFFRNSNLPESVGSLTYATATIRNVSMVNVSIATEDPTSRSGMKHKGVAINYIYDNSIVRLVDREHGICSAYRKFSDTELYIGIEDRAESQTSACNRERFLTLERYKRAP